MSDLPLRAWLCIEQPEAAQVEAGRTRGPAVSNLPGGEGHCYFTSTPDHLTTCGWFLLVAAVLRSSE